jgi:hypothetical protein
MVFVIIYLNQSSERNKNIANTYDATKHCSALENVQSLCEDLYVIAGISPKRLTLFAKIQDKIDSDCVLRLRSKTSQGLGVQRGGGGGGGGGKQEML